MQLEPEQVTTQEAKTWRGLHLLHFQGSSCSQKVRILLSEKGLPWESHPVDLARKQNATPWFLGINPRGVVPVLVQDGTVHIESNDILELLDALPSHAAPFFPAGEAERATVRDSLALEDSLHLDLRTITMGFLFPSRLTRKSKRVLEAYETGGAPDPKRDREVRWWRDFGEHGITAERAERSSEAFRRAFETLEERLTDRPWVIGDRISVLELAWFISIHRLVLAGYPLERHARLQRHYGQLLERPAFARETKLGGPAGAVLGLYRLGRRLSRSTLASIDRRAR